MKRDRYVYGLYAGDQPMPCYIGIGKGRRMFDHIKAASTGRLEGNKRKSLTLIACHKRKIHIIAYKLITNITLQEAYKHEKRLIAFYGRRDLKTGCLLNACAGGHGS